jgi:subtilisin-like proprotein convertase family protein
VITLPNTEGKLEQFEVYEGSNFEPDLQAQFPEIRAFSGQGITDKYATLKLSISPQGIQTMVFRTDSENEFIEAYSQDHTVYAVFKSQREKGKLAWSCSVEDQKMTTKVTSKESNTNKFDDGTLRVMRLAQSCNGEYANYFGATSAAQVSLVLAAFNNTLTRCNGVYEKDLALHLNLVAGSTNIIYYDGATDPYSPTIGPWNTELQVAINTTLTGTGTTLAANNAAYDIGHMFGKTGGGGNAGCIGCVCVDAVASGAGATKGRGITSPADGIPQGDNFDIDYVVHEIGHQLGGNHTFSNSNEGYGVNKEVGSGITIMGYAGITGYDVAAHSIDVYHEATIAQIQANLAGKSCTVVTNISANNATPVVSPVSNYTIPKSTPFVLIGAATDANAGDALTYSWEQNDDGGASTAAASNASATKTVGPNFLSWSPTASPSRYFPKLSSVIANSNTTANIGGDAGMLSEALSSVARILNFRLTVRDNSPYSSTSPVKVGQTAFTNTIVTVNATAGPFLVSSPNTAVSWTVGDNQNVTWDVAGTNSNGVNAPFVDIFLSTDGGLTYPIQLASKVPNDGSEIITVPNNAGSTNRVMVKGNGHIFFDISNANFTIAAPPATFAVAATGVQTTSACGLTSTTFSFDYSALSGFAGTTTFSAAGNPAGSTVSFSPASMTASGQVTMTIGNLTGLGGDSNILVTATSGATTKTVPFYLYLGLSNVVLTSPANNATAQNTVVSLNWTLNPSATSYDVQVASDAAFTTIVSSGNVATNSYNASGLATVTDYFWRVLPKNATCTGIYGSEFKFTTGNCATSASTNVPIAIPVTVATVTSTLNIPSGSSISDVNVNLNITHTWINDLTATLKSPAGTVVQLFANPCTNASIKDINATFDDSGIAIVCGNSPGISGTVLPAQALSAFNGQNSTGTWTLTVIDGFAQDGGAINSWSLNICSVAPLGVEDNEFTDFILFPNPNNGDFTLKFSSGSSDNIKVNVHDMRGRQVYSNSYANKGTFNQNINLDKVQAGVYLVSITDGTKKTVKRIVVE